ncbi:MAG: extracellular solute-binding protein [Chloroflexi bacterium]|nr:extracellular solute-binding protein [Chloroflexota bacterium]
MSVQRRTVSRRDFLRLVAAAGGVAALAACAAPAPPSAGTAGAGEAPTAEPVELRVSILQGAPVEPVNEFLRDATTAKHSEVTTKFEFISGDLAELVYAQAAAGTLADVFFSADLFAVPFAKNDVSLDLKAMAESDPDVDLDDVFPAMLGLGTVDNEIHFLPSGLDVVTMYYNKTLFEQAGAALPTDTWTWDDLITNCKLITEMEQDENGNPKYWGLSNATWSWWATIYPWVVGYGGLILADDKSTWSDPKTVEGLQAYADLWSKHNVAQPLGLDVGGDSFQLGRAAIYTHIQALRTPIRTNVADKFEWDVQLMPLMPDGKHRTGMGTWGMSAYSKSKHPELAYEYVKNIITPDVQTKMTKAEIIVPLLRSIAEKGDWMQGLTTPPQNFMAFVNGADDAILPVMDHPADCGSFYVGVVNQAYSAALEAVIRGTKGAAEAFTEADTTIQNCLDENS